MNRRSIRISLQKPITFTEESNIEPVRKKRRKLSKDISSHSTEGFGSSEESIQSVDKLVPKEPTKTKKQKRKKIVSGSGEIEDIQNYYLDKTVTNKSTSLETIYEDYPSSGNLMGKRKIKRLIPFEEITRRKEKKMDQCLNKLSTRMIKSVDVALKNLQDIVYVD